MSFRSHPVQRRRRSSNISSSSSSSSTTVSSNEAAESSTGPSLHENNMDYRQGRVFSQSTPMLVNQADSHGAVASPSPAQSAETYRGQTYMEFLRESGASPSRYTLPARPTRSIETSSMASRASERKRRLTTPESPMRHPSSLGMRPDAAGDSSSDPTVVDSSPAPTRPPPLPAFPSQSSLTRSVRRESDIVLPPWQPDSEVSHCPVCGSQFTFFYRKHHCRKCGRVVCSACSPHRITIPRQFIVHPPADMASGSNIIDLADDDDANTMSAFGPFRNPALGGGEEVRVCNPCVPDPNYSPPPPYTPGPASRYSSHYSSPIRSPYPPGNAQLSRPQHPSGHRTSQSVNDGVPTVAHGQTLRPRDPFSDRRVSYRNSTRVADLWPPPQSPQPPQYGHHASHNLNVNSVLPRPNPSSTPAFPSAESDAGNHTGRMIPRHFMLAPAPPQPPPRRQIAEEDECPICGNELPAKGPNDDDSARTQHVEDCIALHSASPLPPAMPQTSTSLPNQRTRGMSNPPTLAGNGEGASNRNRLSMAARGMIVYKATEKDCVDEEGGQAECVICFEEFEAGDQMGRLVCWCKFHENCIKKWWEKKGRGACPTHQLHE